MVNEENTAAGRAVIELRSGRGARQRILDTSDQLLYAQGVRATGVDQLIQESRVTKATFYKYVVNRDNLDLHYAQRHAAKVSDLLRSIDDQCIGPLDAVMAFLDAVEVQAAAPTFRGDPLTLLLADFPDRGHPVHDTVRGGTAGTT